MHTKYSCDSRCESTYHNISTCIHTCIRPEGSVRDAECTQSTLVTQDASPLIILFVKYGHVSHTCIHIYTDGNNAFYVQNTSMYPIHAYMHTYIHVLMVIIDFIHKI
jgi:hypothetical protein